LTTGTLFNPPHADLLTEEGMPAIMNFQIIADMGRMNG